MEALAESLRVRTAQVRGERVGGLGTCSKCDDHNTPCVCPQDCGQAHGCHGHCLVVPRGSDA